MTKCGFVGNLVKSDICVFFYLEMVRNDSESRPPTILKDLDLEILYDPMPDTFSFSPPSVSLSRFVPAQQPVVVPSPLPFPPGPDVCLRAQCGVGCAHYASAGTGTLLKV